jgi:hypothetical protein
MIGPFDWDDLGLSVACDPPDDEGYPDLWRWEIQIDAMEETIQMRISPIHPIADVIRPMDIAWDCDHDRRWAVWGTSWAFNGS